MRASEDGALDRDPYSDNVVDICPVGALLSRQFMYKSRVWYLKPTPSVCPGCARGCTVNLWHRKPTWQLKALDPQQNVSIERVTPLENPAVNGPWICNKGRDLARIFERPRAEEPMLKGKPVDLPTAIGAARRADRRREAPGGDRVVVGLERGARGIQRGGVRALHHVLQAGPRAGAGRAARGRLPDPRRQEPEHGRRACVVRADCPMPWRCPPTPTSC